MWGKGDMQKPNSKILSNLPTVSHLTRGKAPWQVLSFAGSQHRSWRWSDLVSGEDEIWLVLGCPTEQVPCCAPGFPGAGIDGRETDLDVKHTDFLVVCVSGKGLSRHLFALMVND